MRKIAMLAVVLLVGTANAQQGPRPAAELERLKPLDGNWTCKGVTPAGAMGAGSPEFKYNSTFTIKPSSNGVAYTIVYDQKRRLRLTQVLGALPGMVRRKNWSSSTWIPLAMSDFRP